MKYLLRHLSSLLLPITILIVVPWLLDPHPKPASPVQLVIGLVIIGLGLYIMARTILGFFEIGRGTLAPWDPPQNLVIAGMYAYVRNPMILGVITVVVGEALAVSSLPILGFAIFAFALNTVYFMFSEEPGLEKRFGEKYREYKRNVPRWIPRLTPWKPQSR
ncbi:MAG TPA: isoprenylcysteine carboxylmethyltransferase family protein [Anaerolineales bacterium]